jgi:hypothetical protein
MPARLQAIVILSALGSLGATHETRNFRIHAPNIETAKLVGAAAEHHRSRLGALWYGHAIKNWGARCDVTVNVNDRVGASGSTRFRFVKGEVFGWRMQVNGSLERILDSVIPHEVNHTILACWFRRKVPRWADEGCATMVEHESEQLRQTQHVEHLMREGRRIPLRVLLSMTRYPSDNRQLMALYAQGYSLTRFMIEQHGHRRFLQFLNDAKHRGWDKAIEAYYEAPNIEGLEQRWAQWVIAGSPRPNLPDGQLLADDSSSQSGLPGSIVRAQNSERTRALEAPEPQAVASTVIRSTNQWQPVSQLARVARARGSLTAPSTQAVFVPRPSPQLRPLVMTRIGQSQIASSREIPDPLPGSIRSVVPTPQPDMRAFDSPTELTEPILRETRLRQLETKPAKAEAFGWERFPNRVRR